MIVEISVVPIGVGESLSRYIARVIDVIKKQSKDFKLTDMGTIIKVDSFTELGKLLDLIREELKDCPRLYFVIKADERFKDYDLDYKVESVIEKLRNG
ncbi:uncharacterized protein, MTH1187 family [Archaeoglobus sulfaticallidus PM70-1]|uniref:Uncharacterized protein, MTH1187 family n=1 Tax=Archaeoglobus sulfaticallidus PM70-1 TaxID=387631 RepID=N0BE05_9EURY|nr:MTH1187 family thiamine-binding protein [Archaeoglobus sulfaticallidus]AGK61859.1 uncharacterized protein, MTH1187 family [Archaeoglobus sulfaticallidus PM70-1]